MNNLIPEFNINSALDLFFANKPRRMTDFDKQAWAGCDGTGLVADIGDNSCVVIDVTRETLTVQVYDFNGADAGDDMVFNFNQSLADSWDTLARLLEVS
jgi:hypothetical protein